ncbi:MAG: hypothetical protein H6Q20_2283 [Bacteroidetes bacterium]|nr:hypothetical protein [Bacteroidota bacterium]
MNNYQLFIISSMVLRNSGSVELVRLLADSRRFLRSPYYSNVVRAFFIVVPKAMPGGFFGHIVNIVFLFYSKTKNT